MWHVARGWCWWGAGNPRISRMQECAMPSTTPLQITQVMFTRLPMAGAFTQALT